MTTDASEKLQGSFRHRVRVRYGEIDSQAVLFNARYLDYADIAITEYFRGLGISFASGSETPESMSLRRQSSTKRLFATTRKLI